MLTNAHLKRAELRDIVGEGNIRPRWRDPVSSDAATNEHDTAILLDLGYSYAWGVRPTSLYVTKGSAKEFLGRVQKLEQDQLRARRGAAALCRAVGTSNWDAYGAILFLFMIAAGFTWIVSGGHSLYLAGAAAFFAAWLILMLVSGIWIRHLDRKHERALIGLEVIAVSLRDSAFSLITTDIRDRLFALASTSPNHALSVLTHLHDLGFSAHKEDLDREQTQRAAELRENISWVVSGTRDDHPASPPSVWFQSPFHAAADDALSSADRDR